MTTHGHDEYGRVLMSSVFSSPERRSEMHALQTIFPDFFYEDEERSVWATAVGSVIFNAIHIAGDPNGPFSRASPSPISVKTLHQARGAGWVTSTLARAIERSFTKPVLIAIVDSQTAERAAYQLASGAINEVCRAWTRLPTPETTDDMSVNDDAEEKQ
jgi:hypothetical protein